MSGFYHCGPRVWVRRAGLLLITAWAGFWVWFVSMVVLSEGPPSYPYGAAMGLPMLAVVLVAWRWRVVGGLLAIGAGIVAAWKFQGSSAILLLTIPPTLGGLLLLAGKHGPRRAECPAASAAPALTQP